MAQKKLLWTAADRIQVQRHRNIEELAGWHSSQLHFMLSQVVQPPQWPIFLGHYLRGLTYELRGELLARPEVLSDGPVRVGVTTALNIIKEQDNG